jgi:hypothetical protein
MIKVHLFDDFHQINISSLSHCLSEPPRYRIQALHLDKQKENKYEKVTNTTLEKIGEDKHR